MELGALMKIIRAVLVACLFASCSNVAAAGAADQFAQLIGDALAAQPKDRRPLPDERRIFDALTAYQINGNLLGIAVAYREYADFLRSSAVVKWGPYYRRNGFLDRSISFNNRLDKARDYSGKALENYERAGDEFDRSGRYDVLTNLHISMALTNASFGEKDRACLEFDHALYAYQLNLQQTPPEQPYFPPGFSSMADYMARERQRVGCKE